MFLKALIFLKGCLLIPVIVVDLIKALSLPLNFIMPKKEQLSVRSVCISL